MDTEVINCSCNTHSIHVSYDEGFNEVAMSFWQCGLNNYKLSWKDRFKILFKGNMYSEMVFLNKEETNKLLGALFLASEKINEGIGKRHTASLPTRSGNELPIARAMSKIRSTVNRQTLERIAEEINENLQNKS